MFLATIVANAEQSIPIVSDILVVRMFTNVFPVEISGLPQTRKLEFGIDVLPSIAPISQAPYWIRDFKTKLQELLENGFICLSFSTWGVSVLLVSKEGSIRLCIDY